MRTWKRSILVAAAAMAMASPTAFAAPMDGDGGQDKAPGESTEPAPAGEDPTIVGYENSDKNVDYKPKSESEGSTWTFDPQKVELTVGNSETGTNFQGARILKGGEDVIVQGDVTQGVYTDDTEAKRYGYWQGSTYFFGVNDDAKSNSVDGIVEFFWFESSIPRGSDFYVMQVKVKSSPNPWDKWFLAQEPNFIDNYIFFWNDVQPSQHLDVYMEAGGAHGALRWDYCIPFETYKWEPAKTMQISETYGAGYSLDATANAQGKASKQFKEGGAVADLTGDAKIQSKGYINNDFKVQSQYTITLYRWQMLVQSGGQDIHYKLVVLPVDKENESESGYYEYFIVIQAERGTPVHIDEIEIGGMFRHKIPLWLDGYQGLAAKVSDIWITPPRGVCVPGDIAPAGTCRSKGVCSLAEPQCVDNKWQCPVLSNYEPIETTCDGVDNDCDGLVDEDLFRECDTACGGGYETCKAGKYAGCDAPQPQLELCGDGVDNDCDGVLDNGCTDPTTETGGEPETGASDTGKPADTAGGNPGTDDPNNGATDKDPWAEYGQDDGGVQQVPTSYGPDGESPNTPVPDSSAAAGCSQSGAPTGPMGGLVVVLMALALGMVLRRQRR